MRPEIERARDRQREILGGAAGLQIVHHGKVELRIGSVQSAAHDFAPLAHPSDRIVVVGEGIAQFMGDHDFLSLPGAPPQIGGAEKLRMQRSAVQTDPHHGYAGRQQPPAQLVEHVQEGFAASRVRHQPAADPLDRVVRRPLRGGPLENGGGDDGLAVDDEGLGFAFGQVLSPHNCRAAERRFDARPRHGNSEILYTLRIVGKKLGPPCRRSQPPLPLFAGEGWGEGLAARRRRGKTLIRRFAPPSPARAGEGICPFLPLVR